MKIDYDYIVVDSGAGGGTLAAWLAGAHAGGRDYCVISAMASG